MTNREWLMEQMQNMSDEELADERDLHDFICAKVKCCEEYSDMGCAECKLNWLKSEHKEIIKLSEAERVILENVDKKYKWIARDSDGMLGIYDDKPQKDGEEMWHSAIMSLNSSTFFDAFDNLFQFIKWSDNEAYEISELLKGE